VPHAPLSAPQQACAKLRSGPKVRRKKGPEWRLGPAILAGILAQELTGKGAEDGPKIPQLSGVVRDGDKRSGGFGGKPYRGDIKVAPTFVGR
jgi:hypothetical protein